ncbi:MAG: hypothetical protein JWO13_2270 [Acidobacteriales bacterium]|nr:hypothetical protein [Terriglobales bacterium]
MKAKELIAFARLFGGSYDSSIERTAHGMASLRCRNRGRIEGSDELESCEYMMDEPRMSREVYDELDALVKEYKQRGR